MFWIVLAIVSTCVVFVIIIYNKLVQGKSHVQEGWSGVEVQLKRRHDLIPNLVIVVKNYAGYERSVLEKITLLRSQAAQTNNLKERSDIETNLSQNLKTIFAISEQYPNIKADQNFLALHNDLTKIEDELQLARRYYNGCVRNYNILTQVFPNNLIANTFHFNKSEFFQLDEENERLTPNVQL